MLQIVFSCPEGSILHQKNRIAVYLAQAVLRRSGDMKHDGRGE